MVLSAKENVVSLVYSLLRISRQQQQSIKPGWGLEGLLSLHTRETGSAYEQIFSGNVQIAGILGFAGHTVFVTTAPGGIKAATENT